MINESYTQVLLSVDLHTSATFKYLVFVGQGGSLEK